MKCQNCGRNEATYYYKSSINGRVTETHLCADCARKLGYVQRMQPDSFFGDDFFSHPFRLFEPLLGGFGLWSDLLQGLILGALLALLLPLSGASRRKEPFATLLVVPMIALIVLLALQLMRALGVALPFQPVSGCTMMIECTFLSFMTVQAIRTKT